jgi:beta-glucanase (GH16 family)
LAVGVAIGVIGILVLTAGVAWPREPLGRPPAGAAAPAADGMSDSPDVPTVSPPFTPSGPASGASPPASAAPSTAPAVPPPPPIPGWTLVAYDDFSGDRLDRRKWAPYDSAATNGVSRWSPSMLTVAGGELRIAGQGRDPNGNGNVSGALCWCELGQIYGMWQVRARFDAGLGYGQALILWPDSNHWPQDGELDFAETPTETKKTVAFTIHWGDNNSIDYARATGDFTQWHTYTVVWKADSVKMLIDDKTYYDSTTSRRRPQIPHNPMHLAIQQEPGPLNPADWIAHPGATTPDRVTMHIDWVRVYR